jgi:hypothetical protein
MNWTLLITTMPSTTPVIAGATVTIVVDAGYQPVYGRYSA